MFGCHLISATKKKNLHLLDSLKKMMSNHLRFEMSKGTLGEEPIDYKETQTAWKE